MTRAYKPETMAKKCVAAQRPEYISLWHPTRNGDKTPHNTPAFSKYVVWWLNAQCQHEWDSPVRLTAGKRTGCPFCSGHRLLRGFNDLLTKDPILAQQWHPTLNGTKRPQDFLAGSADVVYWLGHCGHAWPAKISLRSSFRKRATGCPVCTGKMLLVGFNDLSTVAPWLAAEWHPTDNGELKPTDVTKGHSKKIAWLGKECGHAWRARIGHRLQGESCAVCAGKLLVFGVNDFATLYPLIASQWHPTRNGAKKPQDYTVGADVDIWWLCREGHEWNALLYTRRVNGCPDCKTTGTSKIENKVREYLRENSNIVITSINHNNVLRLGPEQVKAQIDILGTTTKHAKIVIQYDGYRWHRKPEVRVRDEQVTRLLLADGYKVIRIREHPRYVPQAEELQSLNVENKLYVEVRFTMNYSSQDITSILSRLTQDIEQVLN